MSDIERRKDLSPDITFDFIAVLKGRASSAHTHRAYARWIDQYLSDMTPLQPTTGKRRMQRMHHLPLSQVIPIMNSTLLRTWLGQLAEKDHGKQALNQARAAVLTLASLLSEAGWMDDAVAAGMTNVKLPRAESGQRQGRWLSVDQVKVLMAAAEDVATSPQQRARNAVVIKMLCVMALRREELTEIRWKDLHTQAGRPVLLVHGKGSKAALVDMPGIVLQAVEDWRPLVADEQGEVDAESHVVRRVYRSGFVSPKGLTTDAIWRIVRKAALHAGIGKVAPHDLRRSIAGNLEISGVPVETISRLLRHSNIAVTQNYLSKLPRENEGAILMADLLGFD
jgi:site-specific recombinase XerD